MSDDQQYPHGHEQGGQYGQGHYGQGQYGEAQYDQYGRYQHPDASQQAQTQDQGQRQDQDQGQWQDQGQGQGQGQAEPRGQAPSWAELQQQGQEQQGPGAAQTWQGQTWDTQYQPQAQWQQGRHAQQGQQSHYPQTQTQAQSGAQGHQTYQPQQSAAADTAYLPPQAAYPLPPEVPAAAAGSGSGSGPYEPSVQAPAQAHAPAHAAAPADTTGYSAPTVMGNARVTDAQRARAEGRSPIIPPGIQPAGLTAVLGLLLAGGAAIGPYALLVPLVLLQAVTAAGWFRLNGMWPARQGIALAFLGGVAADIALLAAGRENAPAAILGTLGVWVLLTVVLQLRSHASADERMYGLMATVVSAALAILATGHLAAAPDAVVVGALAVAAATVVRALPLPGIVSVIVSLLVAAGAGAAAGGLTDLGTQGALLGLGAGVCALIGLRAASYDYPSRFVHMTAGVALPLTAAAPAVYLLGRVLA
ncbi:hypothetical protein [Streptomyces sp. NPDC051569]|uniref:hypothetical protein n=1 Tax=Streptomyces sp. NPDC051569 TaxID=3365661 RepID=UPI0037BD05B3